jgi:hypothetical protein
MKLRSFAWALVVAALTPVPARAAPLDDKIQLLRARPTGMDEAEWRRQRREVARELGEIRNERAVDALIEIVETERYDAVLSIAITGLGSQGDTRALPALQRVYADRSLDTFVREEAGKAIRALGATPRDDARLTGAIEKPGETPQEGLAGGPQLGTMGAASAPDDELPPPRRSRALPANLRGRDRAFSLAFGSLDLRVNSLDVNQRVSSDAGLGVRARYADDRHGWGWSADGLLSASIVNGDFEQNGGAADAGDTLWIREGLSGRAEAHVYIKESNWHAFVGLGASQRLAVASVQDDADDANGDQSGFSSTRFALDVVPGLGIGWGRWLNAGADLMVDAVVVALQEENILARPMDAAGRQAIQYAVFQYANDQASYPRMASALAVLRERGYLARAASPRLIYRLIRIIDDPSYVDRMEGPRVRVGFAFGLPVGQGEFVGRSADTAQAGPAVELVYGIQIDREREVQIDTRLFYDALFQVTGYSTDTGALYRRNFHGKYQDYLGQWYLGLRGGVSHRNDTTLPGGSPPERPGWRAMLLGGYSYRFNRGSRIDAGASAGFESGALLVGVGVGFTFGLAHGSVLNAASRRTIGASKRNAAPAPAPEG